MRLLLHSCCAPCSTTVIENLKEDYDITVLFYNPNIEPKEEYIKRKNEQIRLLKTLDIPYMEIDYQNEKFNEITAGLENEPEKGQRCHLCYSLRLQKTAKIAAVNDYDYFGTTLTVSPYKDKDTINELGNLITKQYKAKTKYLLHEIENGFKKSVELSKEHNLYRQNYCGCRYSRRD